jgi:hypothetical protein
MLLDLFNNQVENRQVSEYALMMQIGDPKIKQSCAAVNKTSAERVQTSELAKLAEFATLDWLPPLDLQSHRPHQIQRVAALHHSLSELKVEVQAAIFQRIG